MLDPQLLAPDGSLAMVFLVLMAVGCVLYGLYCLLTTEEVD